MFTAFFTSLIELHFGPSGDYDGGPTATVGTGKVFIGNGTGLNKADTGHHSDRSLAASSNEDLDLQALLDAHDDALTLTGLVLLRIEAKAANLGNLEVKPASSNGWLGAAAYFKDVTDTVTLIPGAVMHVECRLATAYTVSGAAKA
ncbi:MAG: hypothetical protein ACTSWM_04835, partial [Alphaproteobacteria bacterium]